MFWGALYLHCSSMWTRIAWCASYEEKKTCLCGIVLGIHSIPSTHHAEGLQALQEEPSVIAQVFCVRTDMEPNRHALQLYHTTLVIREAHYVLDKMIVRGWHRPSTIRQRGAAPKKLLTYGFTVHHT